tara:strand:- start:1625 stop:1789 length:165 start_codon:yes stop_codon:yes gene_type:complete
MSKITVEQLDDLKRKMEDAKVMYLKYAGAVEVMESILNPPPPAPKEVEKVKKKK